MFIPVIVGPTASSKTEISIFLAKSLGNVEIISCDSMAIYKEMNIGTAKPSKKEREEVRHHLIDILSVKEDFNAARYVELARSAITEINARNNIPLIVGGSMMYIYSLLDGIFKGPARNEEIREKLLNRVQPPADSTSVKSNRWGPKGQGARVQISSIQYPVSSIENKESLYEELKRVDPETAKIIHHNDFQRILRALEVYYASGVKLSDFKKEKKGISSEYDVIVYALFRKRSSLYERIEKRVDAMLKEGLINEVKDVYSSGMSMTAYQGYGYKEIAGYLKGDYDCDEAIRLIKRNTRRFAKRQITWLKRDSRINWILCDNFSSSAAISDYIKEDLKKKGKL